jgi:hypothetical protein
MIFFLIVTWQTFKRIAWKKIFSFKLSDRLYVKINCGKEKRKENLITHFNTWWNTSRHYYTLADNTLYIYIEISESLMKFSCARRSSCTRWGGSNHKIFSFCIHHDVIIGYITSKAKWYLQSSTNRCNLQSSTDRLDFIFSS